MTGDIMDDPKELFVRFTRVYTGELVKQSKLLSRQGGLQEEQK